MKNVWRYLLLIVLINSLSGTRMVEAVPNEDNTFIVKPYLQLGNNPIPQKTESLDLLWITDSNQDSWEVQTKSKSQNHWSKQKAAENTIISYSVPDKLYLWDNSLQGLEPGEKFQYKITKNGQDIFNAAATARKTEGQSSRVVLFGDTGADTAAEKKIVYQTYLNKPDFLIILGDITYSFGRLSEYLAKFFPIFSNEKASAQTGAPLLQSTVTLPVIGNHDIAYGDNKSGINFDRLRDALAYYQVWSAPLNGPLKSRTEKDIPKLLGSTENINRYLQSTNGRYPTMSNYSFDYGNSHWLIVDANPYMSWTNEKLRNWVRTDLTNSKDKTWKFVCFHQPGFSIDKVHSTEQRMRLLSDIFQDCGVDVVFSGHAHNYQKSYPMTFNPKRITGNPSSNADGTVSGDFILDKTFDGKKLSHPNGIIYIVSGGGGAALYGAAPHSPDSTNFIDKFDASTHSLTVCDIKEREFKLSQISEDGKIIDSFKITK